MIAVVVAAAAAGCEREAAEPAAAAPPRVEVATPVVREVTEWDEYTGRLEAIETVEIRPRVSGFLESIHFAEGALVEAGDLLFVIDPRPYRATLAAAEAEVASAQVRVDLATNNLQLAEGLLASNAVSVQEFDTRSKAVLEATAALDAARARVEQARLDVEFTEVRAPISGRVSDYFVTAGNLVSSGAGAEPLTRIVSLQPIHCVFDVSELDYLKYARLAASGSRASSREAANPVQIALADEREFSREGRMDFVDNRMDRNTGTMRGRAIFANEDGGLTPGLFVRVRLLGETVPRAVLIPDSAIGADQANRVVYVVDERNVVQLRTVTTGRLVDGLRVIRSGLEGNERIVVNGLQRVRPNTAVEPEVVEIGVEPGAGGGA